MSEAKERKSYGYVVTTSDRRIFLFRSEAKANRFAERQAEATREGRGDFSTNDLLKLEYSDSHVA